MTLLLLENILMVFILMNKIIFNFDHFQFIIAKFWLTGLVPVSFDKTYTHQLFFNDYIRLHLQLF